MSRKIVDCYGTEHWYLEGVLHRAEGPAVTTADGTQEWYFQGKRHRADGPAIVCMDGDEFWYRDGKRHRLDGPAILRSNGNEFWYRDGLRHRLDGPAIILPNGADFWHLRSESVPSGSKRCEHWYLHGESVSDLNIVSIRIQRWYRMRKIRKLMCLLNTEGPFSYWFDSPEGWGGKWQKHGLEKFVTVINS